MRRAAPKCEVILIPHRYESPKIHSYLCCRYRTVSIVVPSAVSGFGTARILVVGGYSKALMASCEWYDPATQCWSEGEPLNVARHSASLCVLDRCVLAVGGVGELDHPSIESECLPRLLWVVESMNVMQFGVM